MANTGMTPCSATRSMSPWSTTAGGTSRRPPSPRTHGPGRFKRRNRRRPYRIRRQFAGRPRPLAIGLDPAAVMRRRKTPRFVVDPAPPPGRKPSPMPIAIRRPTGGQRLWHPHFTVFVARLPATGIIERRITGDLARHEIRCRQPRIVDGASFAPFDEFVVGRRLDLRRHRPGGAQQQSVAGCSRQIDAVAGKASVPGERRDTQRTIAAADIDVVAAALQRPYSAAAACRLSTLSPGSNPRISSSIRPSLTAISAISGSSLITVISVPSARSIVSGPIRISPRVWRIGVQRHSRRNRIVDRGSRPLRFPRTAELELSRNQADPPNPDGWH